MLLLNFCSCRDRTNGVEHNRRGRTCPVQVEVSEGGGSGIDAWVWVANRNHKRETVRERYGADDTAVGGCYCSNIISSRADRVESSKMNVITLTDGTRRDTSLLERNVNMTYFATKSSTFARKHRGRRGNSWIDTRLGFKMRRRVRRRGQKMGSHMKWWPWLMRADVNKMADGTWRCIDGYAG